MRIGLVRIQFSVAGAAMLASWGVVGMHSTRALEEARSMHERGALSMSLQGDIQHYIEEGRSTVVSTVAAKDAHPWRAAGTEIHKLLAALDKLEKRLVEAPFLGGLAYSLADVAAAPFIDRLEEMQMAGLWANRPVVAAWIARVKARPAYRTAIPRTNQRFQLAPAAGCGRGV